MKGFLLDTNLLIALYWPSHAHHQEAIKWFVLNRHKGWATCPMTQTGFVRIVSNPAFSRDAVSPREAIELLAANMATKEHVFWTDDLTLTEATSHAGIRLVGHQQITDSYLLALALRNGGKLATLDRRMENLLDAESPIKGALELLR